MKKKIHKVLTKVILNLFFIFCCFLALIPILYAFSVSLGGQNSLLGSDFSFIPKDFTFANYKAVFVEIP